MAAYKDEARGTWYVSFHYNDWTGKNKRKLRNERTTDRATIIEKTEVADRSRLWRSISLEKKE